MKPPVRAVNEILVPNHNPLGKLISSRYLRADWGQPLTADCIQARLIAGQDGLIAPTVEERSDQRNCKERSCIGLHHMASGSVKFQPNDYVYKDYR